MTGQPHEGLNVRGGPEQQQKDGVFFVTYLLKRIINVLHCYLKLNKIKAH